MKSKFYFFDSDALKNFHKRIFFSITIFFFVYLIAFYRIFDVMILDSEIIEKQNSSQIIERGKIYDRNGNLLSSTIRSYALSVNPKKIKNKLILSKNLSQIISVPADELIKLFSKKDEFVWIKKNISPKEHQSIIDLGEVALQTQHKYEEELKRIYPYGQTGSHILGFVNDSGNGQSGVERGLNVFLANGKDINLSIDINLQETIRKELKLVIEKYSADAGFALVMDINNGELLSMSSLPDFDPNKRSSLIEKNIFNRIISGNYEMGSVIKPITITTGIYKKIIKPEMTFDVSKSISGINDFHPYNGFYNVKEIVVNSSNIGTAQIASLIGKKNQKDFFKKIGFNKKIDFEIKESAKPLGNIYNWGNHETMRIGYGYSFSITPLHLVKAYASLANDGFQVNPTILKKITEEKEIKIIDSKTSQYFTSLLRSVVTDTKFTGKKVQIDGYQIGGKTGTANLLNENGAYQEGRNLTSFIAVFPTSKPQYVVLSSIENPKKYKDIKYKLTGATVAAPLVKNIILRMIEILNVLPTNYDEILKADISSIYQKQNNASF